MYETTDPPGYGVPWRSRRHPGAVGPLRELAIVTGAVAVAIAVWTRDPGVAALGAIALVAPFRDARYVAVVAVVSTVAAIRSHQSWDDLAPDRLGPYDGWVRIVDDPQPFPASTRVIVEVESERFEIWSRGRAQQLRVRAWRAGEWVVVSGVRQALDAERAGRVAWQHVVGEFELRWASDVDPGGAVARASNRVRASIERAADVLPADDGALYRGLVVGDDRDQPRAMIERFRASGLSHLTAVSGQNVAFVLAACGPLLRRLRPLPRWIVTVGVIAWFAALTRFEPSILRAGTMAALSATAFAIGRERAPARILAVAVVGLLLVDPLLAWSVGFWLSVGATAGVATVGPWIAARCSGLGPLAMPFGITLGAQVGVVVPAVLVFGRLPLVSIPANLLAVPVASAVMLYGLPAGLVAGWVPALAVPLMLPVRLGTRWVDTVAALGERVEPSPPWSWVGWAVLVMAMVAVVAFDVRRGKNRARDGDPPADR